MTTRYEASNNNANETGQVSTKNFPGKFETALPTQAYFLFRPHSASLHKCCKHLAVYSVRKTCESFPTSVYLPSISLATLLAICL